MGTFELILTIALRTAFLVFCHGSYMEEDEKSAVIGGDWYYVASTNRLESIGPGIMHESSKTKRH